MRDKISFLVLTHQGSPSRQFVTSKQTIKTLSLTLAGLVLVVVVAAGYMFYDYRKLNKAVAEMDLMEELVVTQQEEIIDQREEIVKFARKIDALDEDLSALKAYEEKVRKIAGIKGMTRGNNESTKVEKSEFGVGGPLPEDVQPDLELKKKTGSINR